MHNNTCARTREATRVVIPAPMGRTFSVHAAVLTAAERALDCASNPEL